MLFLQGTRDALAIARPDSSRCARRSARAPRSSCSSDADHSFHVPARSGRKDADVMREMLDAFALWLDETSRRADVSGRIPMARLPCEKLGGDGWAARCLCCWRRTAGAILARRQRSATSGEGSMRLMRSLAGCIGRDRRGGRIVLIARASAGEADRAACGRRQDADRLPAAHDRASVAAISRRKASRSRSAISRAAPRRCRRWSAAAPTSCAAPTSTPCSWPTRA